MKINVAQQLTNLAGQPLSAKDKDGKEDHVLLRTVCINALLAPALHQRAQAEEKVRHALLAQRIYREDALDLKAEEVAELKRVIGEMYPPLVVMRAWELLDPSEVGT